MLTSQRRSTLCPYTTLFRSIFLNGQKKGVEKVSQPNIPDIDPNISLTREDAINLLLTSIAMEELGLAHIINAEGEKIQYALETLGEDPENGRSEERRVGRESESRWWRWQ